MGFLGKLFSFIILLISIGFFYIYKEKFLNQTQLQILKLNLDLIFTKGFFFFNYVQKNYFNKSNIILENNQKSIRNNICDLKNDILFTKNELAKFDGLDGNKKLYLGFLGIVYDVSKGEEHYGPKGSYAFFSGKDASRAFITGDFSKENLIDDLTGIKKENLSRLEEWIQFYEKNYKRLGRLIGHFYNKYGCPTQELEKIKKILIENLKEEDDDEIDLKLFPPCNIEWNEKDKKTKYSCTNRSGGIKREWVGVPRKYFKNKDSDFRCACVRNFGPQTKISVTYYEKESDDVDNKSDNVGDLKHPNIKEFEGCDPESIEFIINNNLTC